MLEIIARLAAGLVLVVANAYFVATEFALTRVRQYPRSDFEGHPSLRRAWEMTERLEIHLTGCQVGITLDGSLQDHLDVVAERQHVRFPILNKRENRYEGAIYVPQLLARLEELREGRLRLRDLATPLVRVRADRPVSEVIDELQANDQELALVEEDSRVVGLVTITDTFEAIAGELRDPLD